MLQHNKIAPKWHLTVNDSLPVTMRTGPITPLRAQNCLQTQSPPGLCFISLCGKLKLEPKKGSWEALELKRSHFTSNSSPCCGLSLLFPFMSFSHSLSFLCSTLPLQKPLLPSKNPSSFWPPSSSSAAVSRSLPNPGGEKLRFCYGVWVSDLSIASNPA